MKMIHEAAEHITKFLLGSAVMGWESKSRFSGFESAPAAIGREMGLRLFFIFCKFWVPQIGFSGNCPQALSLPTQKELDMIESFISKFVRVTDENELILIN